MSQAALQNAASATSDSHARAELDPWLLAHLVCPIDHSPLRLQDDELLSQAGRRYPLVDGVPIMLVPEAEQTLWIAGRSAQAAQAKLQSDPYYVDTVAVKDETARQLRESIDRHTGGVDPVVSYLIQATNGNAYQHLIGKLQEYPIPELRLPPGEGKLLLDIGCSWGRWCIAAARKGYIPVGIDPSLGAVLAGRRVARQLGLACRFVVADARQLPFRQESFQTAFSYSVLQHFSRENARTAIQEIGRVLAPGGNALVEMPNVLGLRCLYQQARRKFRTPMNFDVRYYTVPALRRLFQEAIGPARVSVDCFFGIGLQRSDLHLMPRHLQAVVLASEALRKASRIATPLVYAADSLYVHAEKPV